MTTRVTVVEPLQAVTVNREMCQRLATVISCYDIPEDREEIQTLEIPHWGIGNFFLVLVGICHRTSPPNEAPLMGIVNGVTRTGWDYLLERFYEAVRADLDLLTPECWSQFSTKDIRRIFDDFAYGARLVDPEGRASLIRDLGIKMMGSVWKSADDIFRHCNACIATGKPNLLEVLSAFRAYSDPVRKKSLYFLSLMRNNGRWEYRDAESLGPPVDYHEVRGHLRLGTVQINDPTLLRRVQGGQAVALDEDIVLRRAVYDAIVIVSNSSGGHNPSQLHYLFWNLFRAVCLRQKPECFEVSLTCTLPQRYRHFLRNGDHERCPFADICLSAGAADPLCEHICQTDYY